MTDNTSVRVAVRVRPLVPNEISKGSRDVLDVIEENEQIVIKTLDNDKAYTYNYVLSTCSTQDALYNRCVKPLLGNLFKVLFFNYVMHTKQQNVFKRRVEEAEAINKRLKLALSLKQQAQESRNIGKAERIEPWLKQEFDLCINLIEAEATLKVILDDRATLQHQLDQLKNNGDADDSADVKSIEEDLELRSVQIQDLQQKLLGSDEDDSGPAEPTGVKATMKLLESTGQMSTLQPALLNNTRKAEVDLIFFNRVPKVGSQTLMELMRRLSIRNEFGFHQDMVQRVETIRLSPEDRAVLAALISSYDPPGVYIKHVCFTNISSFGLPEPIYINLVRDPVERVISWYYYVRAPWYYVERKIAFPDIPLPDPKWLKKSAYCPETESASIHKYLRGEIREGIGDHRRQSMFFCGHHPDCLPFNTQGALERAKRAVEQNYAVVGVLEDLLNTTLTVLEHYVPRFFEGASDMYWNEISRYNPINKNNFKPPVSEEVKNIVRKNFTREIEFYEFCKQRLYTNNI